MSEIKCPICGKPMKQATYDYDKKDNDDTLYMSIMPCDCVCNFAASKAVWQELIRTRKALDVAVDALKDNLSQANFTQMLDASRFHCIRTKCESALAEITALEQKDVK